VNFEWTSNEIATAEAELVRRASGLAPLVERWGPCTLPSRREPVAEHFEALASSIVYQQLAGRAAAAIWGRVQGLAPGAFLAERVVLLQPQALRSAGLSGAKAAAVADLAARVVGGALDLDQVAALDDEEVIARLSEVRGIGRWTAQMFLIFRLGRLDVWPAGDLGVRRGYAVIHELDEAPGPTVLEALGDTFRPWRSIMAWYCWRALDTSPARV
jgi:3-methyladenine DNA glycosylase/8-oxoguanine DNA glycosylase